MLLAPVKGFIRTVALLPAVLRPGVALAIAFLVIWLIAVRPRVPALYHALCRTTARAVNMVVGLVLLPEYAVTANRRRRGLDPGAGAVMTAQLTGPLLSGTDNWFERHQTKPLNRSLVPWWLIAAIIAVCAAAWLVMDKVAPTSSTRHGLTVAFQYWRDVESWAEVNPSRRAASGGWYPPPPTLRVTQRHGPTTKLVLECPGSQTCRGTVVLSVRGKILASRRVTLKPRSQTATTITIPKRRRHPHGRLLVVVVRLSASA